MINYARHRRKIEKMYIDRVEISRWEEIKVGGATRNELVVKYTDQRCFLSQRALSTNGQTEAVNEIQYQTKLFIAPDVDVLQGDVVDVTRGSLTRTYTAGEPFMYPSHQEISLERDTEA